jgi:hypothetical protein
MALIRFLIIALCIYLTIKWVIGPLLRLILQNFLKSMVEKHTGTQQQHRTSHKKDEGTIHVDYIPKSPKDNIKKNSEGEYIDYEEIK